MNDKMKTVREALEEAIAIDRRDNGGDPSMYTTQLEAAIAALDSMEAEAHPKAQGEVELTEEDLAEIAHQQWRKGLRELSLTLSGAKLMEDGAMNALRHLTSKYRLIPR
jgi:hypothetical protein